MRKEAVSSALQKLGERREVHARLGRASSSSARDVASIVGTDEPPLPFSASASFVQIVSVALSFGESCLPSSIFRSCSGSGTYFMVEDSGAIVRVGFVTTLPPGQTTLAEGRNTRGASGSDDFTTEEAEDTEELEAKCLDASRCSMYRRSMQTASCTLPRIANPYRWMSFRDGRGPYEINTSLLAVRFAEEREARRAGEGGK